MIHTRYTDNFLANLLADGGATINLDRTLSPVDTGYAVGGGRWCHDLAVNSDTAVLRGWIARLVGVAKVEGHEYLGAWVDEGRIFVEPVVILYDQVNAVRLAELNNQKAYYDLTLGVTHWL